MTLNDINLCKDFAISNGFVIFNNNRIYMNNKPIWGNHLACIYKTNEIFETYEIAMYYLTFTGYELQFSNHAEDIKSYEEFKEKLIDRMTRWKKYYIQLKMNNMYKDFI